MNCIVQNIDIRYQINSLRRQRHHCSRQNLNFRSLIIFIRFNINANHR
ncbi:unnamed protein product [Paramecium sonneborni]|uniref:Uncharacterized protein n=1 Tax=Paramecium sonneborni TaxID=65129 RepID=A0A8S1JXE8_9CILI|nr:unnamed protein product [Paramecium sonneborni]